MSKLFRSTTLSLLCGVAASFCACTTNTTYSVVDEDRQSIRIEAVETTADEEMHKILNTPTDFVLAPPLSRYAWERAELFFRKNTERFDFVAGKGSAITLTNKSSSEPILYQVTRKESAKGETFSINCKSRNNLSEREVSLSCRNLARFIRDGVMEGELNSR